MFAPFGMPMMEVVVEGPGGAMPPELGMMMGPPPELLEMIMMDLMGPPPSFAG